MKRLFVISMLMFTVLACSTGPTEQEVDNLKKAHIAQLEKNASLQKQIDVLVADDEALAEILEEVFTGLSEGLPIMTERIVELEKELNSPDLVDFIVTEEYVEEVDGEEWGVYSYLVGDDEKTFTVKKDGKCFSDLVVGAPLPLSCR